MSRVTLSVLIATLVMGCADGSVSSATEQGICTVADCPEGITLAQMRQSVSSVANNNGASPVTHVGDVGCHSGGWGTQYCWVTFQVGNSVYTVNCDFAGCDSNGCDRELGCEVIEGGMR